MNVYKLTILIFFTIIHSNKCIIISTKDEQKENSVKSKGNQNDKQAIVVSKPIRIKLSDVVITHAIPSVFILNQMFIIEGEIIEQKLIKYLISSSSKPKKTYPLYFIFINKQTSQKIITKQELLIQVRKFRQQLFFNKCGKYSFVVVIGQIYRDVSEDIYTVVSESQYANRVKDVGKVNMKIRPVGLNISLDNNEVYLKWIPQTSLTKVRIYQQQAQIQKIFYISNDKGSLKLPIPQFFQFNPQKQTKIEISHAQSTTNSAYNQNTSFSLPLQKTINITQHHFLDHDQNLWKIITTKAQMLEVGDIYEIVGFCYEEILEVGLLVMPDGKIKEVFGVTDGQKRDGIIQGFARVTFTFSIEQEGVYIFEINHKLGFAIYNTPIYVGNRYPLIPDPTDYLPSNQSSLQLPLQQSKLKILTQINDIRTKYNVTPITMDTKLTKLAEGHCQDMLTRKYVSHINPDKQNSKARAIKSAIYTQIGENIITDMRIQLLQYKLNRSPLHLRNTVNKLWVRVGISLMRNTDGEYYMVQEYSAEEVLLTEDKLDSIKTQVLSAYIKKTQENVVENTNLSAQLKKWFTIYSNQNIGNLKQILSGYGIKSVLILNISLGIGSNYYEEILKNQNMKPLGKKNVGIAVKSQKGNVKIIATFY